MEIQIRVLPESFKTVTEHLPFNTGIPNKPIIDIILLGEWGTVSVQEENAKSELKLYPNPTTNNFVISWENQSSYELEIYSILGSLVYYEIVNSTNKTIDVSHLPKGIYLVKTRSGDVVNQTNLIVK